MHRATLQHRADSASSRRQQSQFLLTNGTAREVRLYQCPFGWGHFPIHIGNQQGLDLSTGLLRLSTIHSHTSAWVIESFPRSCSSRIFRNVFKARSSRDLTVPNGISKIEAISA